MRWIALFLLFSAPAKADIFGGDVAVLSQILVNALQQLAQLRQILSTGRDSVGLVKDINRGINDSLNILRTVSPNTDPGLYRDWQKVQDALDNLEKLYGIVVPSRDERVQRDADQAIAEAISMNNAIYAYAKEIDEIGEEIKAASHTVSPGGAAKLTAESLGVMLHIENETLRTQATGLKLQAQAFALTNRKEKDRTRQMLESAENLRTALSATEPKFELPRF
jgi:hypothetical protein